MDELVQFGEIVLVTSVALLLAVLSGRVAERIRIPAPAVFLVAAAVASDVVPRLGHVLSVRDVGRLGTVALIVILFNGGVDIGWRDLRRSIAPVAVLGGAGTLATAGLLTLTAHWLLGFGWLVSGVLGAALAPTDPAVMFSVLGGRELTGRASTILQAESGANDPVSIALMVGVLSAADSSGWAGTIATEMVVQLGIGLAVGVAGAVLAIRVLHRLTAPAGSLQPIVSLAAAGAVYGAAATLHGSGFLAVFVAGLLLGDAEHTVQGDVRAFHAELAGLAEIVVFIALGLTVHLGALRPDDAIVHGVVLVAVLGLVIRPAVTAVGLARARLSLGERAFVAWAGLRGAVPILLAAFAVVHGIPDGRAVYGIVFVAVVTSVVVQGGLLEPVAAAAGIGVVDPRPGDDGAPRLGRR
jgi:potassium/hydrogen antiporter